VATGPWDVGCGEGQGCSQEFAMGDKQPGRVSGGWKFLNGVQGQSRSGGLGAKPPEATRQMCM